MIEKNDPRETGRARPARPAAPPPPEEPARGSPVPFGRPVAIAAAVVVAAAAFLFWPHGAPESPGIGERYTVVEAGPESAQGTTAVRSGDVEIASEITSVTPEATRRSQTPPPASGASAPAPVPVSSPAPSRSSPAATTPAVRPSAPPAATPPPPAPVREEIDRPVVEPPIGDTEVQVEEETPTPAPGPTPEPVPASRPDPVPGQTAARPVPTTPRPAGPQPSAQGSWAVQAGAFGTAANAEDLIARLQDGGFSPFLKAGNTADGRMVYRVWIGWFATREQAADFAARNRARLGDTLVQHR